MVVRGDTLRNFLKLHARVVEVTEADVASRFPVYAALRGADVCVLAAAYPDVELEGRDSIGWRGEITGIAGAGDERVVQVFSSWLELSDADVIRPLSQG